MATLKTHRPSGHAPWPLILLTGDTGSGRSWSAAEFTGSDRIGRSFWMDLGEACAEEYGTVPGADYEVVDHNGTWIDIVEQAEAVRDVAKAHAATNKPPVLFVIDSMTHEWAMLSSWADKRARRQKGNKAKLADDADAEVDITMNLWNDANSRHNRLMNILKTFPGVVIVIADEKEIAQLDKGGNPIAGKKEWKPEGHKFLGRDSRVWIRMFRDDVPQVVKCRSVKYGIRPGVDKPKRLPDFSFEWLVFELLGCDPATTKSAPDRTLDADQLLPEERTAADAAPTVDDPRGEPTDTAEESPRDWAAEIERCVGAASLDGLRKLWSQATHSSPDILSSINNAAARVRENLLRAAVDGLLDAPTPEAAVQVMSEISSGDQAAAKVPVTGDGALPSGEDCETLGIHGVDYVELLELAEKVVNYWDSHGHGPRALPDAA